MRILLTVHEFLPEHSAGTEVLTLTSALALRERGHDVRILTGFHARTPLSDHERFDRYEYRGIPVDRFKRSAGPMGSQANFVETEYNNLLVAAHFERLLDGYRPDVVHFFHLMRLSASLVDVCSRRRLPMVFTPTDFWFMCPTVHLRLPDGAHCDGPAKTESTASVTSCRSRNRARRPRSSISSRSAPLPRSSAPHPAAPWRESKQPARSMP